MTLVLGTVVTPHSRATPVSSITSTATSCNLSPPTCASSLSRMGFWLARQTPHDAEWKYTIDTFPVSSTRSGRARRALRFCHHFSAATASATASRIVTAWMLRSAIGPISALPGLRRTDAEEGRAFDRRTTEEPARAEAIDDVIHEAAGAPAEEGNAAQDRHGPGEHPARARVALRQEIRRDGEHRKPEDGSEAVRLRIVGAQIGLDDSKRLEHPSVQQRVWPEGVMQRGEQQEPAVRRDEPPVVQDVGGHQHEGPQCLLGSDLALVEPASARIRVRVHVFPLSCQRCQRCDVAGSWRYPAEMSGCYAAMTFFASDGGDSSMCRAIAAAVRVGTRRTDAARSRLRHPGTSRSVPRSSAARPASAIIIEGMGALTRKSRRAENPAVSPNH